MERQINFHFYGLMELELCPDLFGVKESLSLCCSFLVVAVVFAGGHEVLDFEVETIVTVGS